MRPGDHIRIQIDGGWQHAIDVGDRTVIYFAAGHGVKRSRLSALAPDRAPVEVVTHRERVYPARRVVARAFSRFADAAYAAMFPDSEAFACWCKTGKEPSAPLLQAGAAPAAQQPDPAAALRDASRKMAALMLSDGLPTPAPLDPIVIEGPAPSTKAAAKPGARRPARKAPAAKAARGAVRKPKGKQKAAKAAARKPAAGAKKPAARKAAVKAPKKGRPAPARKAPKPAPARKGGKLVRSKPRKAGKAPARRAVSSRRGR